MATRRPAESKPDPNEVDRLAREAFPPIEWDPDIGEEWADYCARCAVRRRNFRAFVESHGWTVLDMLHAVRFTPVSTDETS